MSLKGIYTAMVTPFDNSGKINYKVTREFINHLIDSGVDGLFILGTNGEFITLTDEEKVEFTKVVMDEVAGRVSVIVGVGGVNSCKVKTLISQVEKLNPDYLSIITPYFISLTQDELYYHYKEVAESTELPILLYNIPSKTGNHLLPETVKALSHFENIVGIKDSSGKIENIKAYIKECEQDFIVLSGTDSLILPTLKAGGSGGIAATSNVLPKLVVSIYKSYVNGELEKANHSQEKLATLREASKEASVPAVFKKAIQIQGFDVGSPRKPVDELTDYQTVEVENMLKQYK